MLIKKNEEPFFYKFLAIAKEIIKKNPKYTPVFYGDDERLYLACGNHAAAYDFQSNLLLDDELREFGKIPYELSELPNGDLMLTKADHFNCQESYLIAVKNFFKKAGYMSKKIMQVAKEDSFRVPRIVETTGRWISEDDNKILAKIGYPNIYMLENIRVNEFRALAEGWNPRYLAAHDDVELNGGQTTISMTVYFNIKRTLEKMLMINNQWILMRLIQSIEIQRNLKVLKQQKAMERLKTLKISKILKIIKRKSN